jgi:hypothetical protein
LGCCIETTVALSLTGESTPRSSGTSCVPPACSARASTRGRARACVQHCPVRREVAIENMPRSAMLAPKRPLPGATTDAAPSGTSSSRRCCGALRSRPRPPAVMEGAGSGSWRRSRRGPRAVSDRASSRSGHACRIALQAGQGTTGATTLLPVTITAPVTAGLMIVGPIVTSICPIAGATKFRPPHT